MTGAAAIATHERAGRVAPARLGLRLGEVTAGGSPASTALRDAPFSAGGVRIGDAELWIDVERSAAVAAIDVRVRNLCDRPLRIESALIGLRWKGGELDRLRFLRHGWQSRSSSAPRPLDLAAGSGAGSDPLLRGVFHSLAVPPPDRAGWHESELVTVVGSSPAGPACCLGALESGRAFGIVYLRPDADGVLAELELRLDAVVEPGGSVPLERVRVALGLDAGALLEEFAEAHGRRAGARVAAPFVAGWCSWYHYFRDVGETDLLRNLEALAAASDELPVDVVQLDDGYQSAVGDWLETNERFPRGLAAVAEEIRGAGFAAGLWTAPFCAVASSRFFAERGDWLLAGADGPHLGFRHPGWSRDGGVFVLDASRPEVTAYLEALYAELRELGFSYLKLDFLHAAAVEAHAADPGVGRAARLRRGLEAVRAGAGPESFLLGSGCPLGAAVGIVDGMRIGPDAAPAPAGVPCDAESAPAAALARVWMHRRLWLNHPDCLRAGDDGLRSETETRSRAAAIACSGGMFVLSDDVRALSRERRALARETLEIGRQVDSQGLPGRARVPDPLASELPAVLVAATAEGATALLVNSGKAAESLGQGAGGAGLLPLTEPPEALLGTRPVASDGDRLSVRLAPGESACFRTRREVGLAVFCDFDGTFSVQDVGATLAKRHAGAQRPRHWARYERGEITAWEYNMHVLDGLDLPRADVERFLEGVELDPGAADLVDWCAVRGVPFRILSDGFDANLYRLQQLHGVSFAFEANHLRYQRGSWRIRAGHPNPGCDCGTGTCKRGRIEAFRARWPGATLVHVGNGRVSDLCGALAADVAFAKDSLAQELDARGQSFEPFETLHDLVPVLERLYAGVASVSGG